MVGTSWKLSPEPDRAVIARIFADANAPFTSIGFYASARSVFGKRREEEARPPLLADSFGRLVVGGLKIPTGWRTLAESKLALRHVPSSGTRTSLW